MFIEILVWYIIVVVIAYILIGIFSLMYKNFEIFEHIYVISWIGIGAILFVGLAIIIGKLFEKIDSVKWFNPIYTFNYLKDKSSCLD